MLLVDAAPVSSRDREQPLRSGDDFVLDRLISDALKSQERFLAGSIELLGLDHVKRELGSKWAQVGPIVHEIAQTEIRRHLSTADHFKPNGETRFVVFFGALDRQKAAGRAALISRAIKARLLEELPEIEERTSVNLFVTEVDPQDLASGNRSLADRLAASLEKMQCEVELVAASQRKTILRDFQVLFAPVWHVEKHITTCNRTVVDTSLIGRGLNRIRALGDEMQYRRTIAEIDCMTLTKAVERLHAASRSDRAIALLVPVNCETFMTPGTEREYLRLLASVPAPYRDKLVIEITGIERNLSLRQVCSSISKVQRHVDRAVAEVGLDSPLLHMFSRGNVYALACSLQGLAEQQNYSLKAFTALAAEAGAVTFAHSANTLGLAGAAVEAGFAHIDGPAIHLNTTEPRPTLRLKPMIDLGVSGTSNRSGSVRAAYRPN
ncbi:hypothetical protein [Pelagibacterium sp. H642]|uniref:hypothetical protein n=1 Tax=Pelagibacterium sp. H642 TaxID=1881069 RepID=UPI0028161577|nr:hypothetical protein [Pelagibacterium sp. H642]WMT92597.1 hypothetical protein NO934_19825 [Pelagibacterium sp. H642]